MQTVSDAWKNNQAKTVVGEGFVEVSLAVGDPDALASASSSDNGAVYISDTQKVASRVDRNIVPYSTLEQNMWILDGSRPTLPTSDIGDSGYVGDVLCDPDCTFSSQIPVVTISFGSTYSKPIPGVTIVWSEAYGEYAEDFIVTAYDGDVVTARKSVMGNQKVKTMVELYIQRYDRITISILRWCLPRHRARIDEIFAGINLVYTKSELMGYHHTQRADPLSTSLPKAEISFSVDNVENLYNPYNENGLFHYLMERQEIVARYGHRLPDRTIEWIKGGTYYLSEWQAPQNGIVAEFTARDMLEFMFGEYKDATTSLGSRSLYELAERVLQAANLPLDSKGNNRWHIDESLRNIYTDAPLPLDTYANCLLMIANAGRCVMYQDRDGFIRIEPLRVSPSDYKISEFNSYQRPEMSINKRIKEVVVNVYTYGYDANGEITSSTVEVVYPLDIMGEQLKVDNPLITDSAVAMSVAEWVAEHSRNRVSLSMDWRVDTRVDVLDTVTVENKYGSDNVLLTEVKFDFGGSFKGSAEGRQT